MALYDATMATEPSTTNSGAAARAAAVRDQILTAAIAVTADPRTSFSFDSVAKEAHLGRRTLFRYFPTRADLLAATVDAMVASYVDTVPPRNGRPLVEWLTEVVGVLVAQNWSRGRDYFDLVLGDHGEVVLAALERRSEARNRLSERLAGEAWAAEGGKGPPPAWVVHTFTLHLGPFATAALHHDAHLDLADTCAVVAQSLLAVVRQAAE